MVQSARWNISFSHQTSKIYSEALCFSLWWFEGEFKSISISPFVLHESPSLKFTIFIHTILNKFIDNIFLTFQWL